MITERSVTRGEILRLHGKEVRVLAINRFLSPEGKILAGAVMLDGDPVARTPRSLQVFAEQATRPRR